MVVAIAGVASAQPSTGDKALAESLFQDGKKLMGAKKYAEACRKLEESQRLDPAGGTLLNLAVCHELEGRTATAWVEFGDALADAQREKRADRQRLAREHLDRLEPKLARLAVTVAPDARAPGLKVTRNGVTINEAGWGTPVPVDPGLYTIVATAPGRKPSENRVNVGASEQRTVVVSRLDPDGSAPAASAPPPKSEPPPPPETSDGRRTLGLVAGGVGIVALGVGAYFGLRTFSKKHTSDAHCPTATTCDAEGVDASDAAHRAATVANIGFGVGLVALGASAYLLLTGKDAPRTEGANDTTSARVRLAPTLGPRGGGVAVGGTW